MQPTATQQALNPQTTTTKASYRIAALIIVNVLIAVIAYTTQHPAWYTYSAGILSGVYFLLNTAVDFLNPSVPNK